LKLMRFSVAFESEIKIEFVGYGPDLNSDFD
jgi:hypothetical protein